jgi:uncharacterized membrane protein YfcA
LVRSTAHRRDHPLFDRRLGDAHRRRLAVPPPHAGLGLAKPSRQLQGTTLATATIVSGAILGVLVTVSSIGAGAVGATLLVMLYPKLTPAEVAGTDIAYAVPLTAIAAAGHWWLGSIDWVLLVTLLVGSVPGITLGSMAARKVPERFLRALLALTLTGVAAKLIY